MDFDLAAVGALFDIEGQFSFADPLGTGHIHETFVATYLHGESTRRYLHQRINTDVFTAPATLMDNVSRVTGHILEKLRAEGADQIDRRVLRIVPTLEGHSWCSDENDNAWRTFHYVEGARTHDTLQFVEQAFATARAFGRFQDQLVDLPAPALEEIIPDFHNTPEYFLALEAAVRDDSHDRAAGCREDVDFVEARSPLLATLRDLFARGDLCDRIVHNDTKVNNVLLDEKTNEDLAVIDLDTVMPGLALYDFGDLVRTAACSAREDETDLSRVWLNLSMFEALVRGYLSTAEGFLNRTEIDHLAFAGWLMSMESGIRFLTDHLRGDTYFKVHRDGHNLDRCRMQLKLAGEIELGEQAMRRIVDLASP